MNDNKSLTIKNSEAEFLTFEKSNTENGIEVRYEDETLWMTQKSMAALFDVQVPTVNEHLKNVFSEDELEEDSVVRNFRITAADGKNYNTKHYNLDAIISVGYRVNSVRATQFRRWATKVLKQFAITGYVIDRKRMENGTFLGEDYFERLLEEIREIRLSERRFYQKVTDIYATSVDYDKDSPLAKRFFATVQNKMHYAITGNTAAELIMYRADSEKEHMGLTSWEKAPDGKIMKSDVGIAKNYLKKDELQSMGRIVNAFLDLAEDFAKRHIPMTMDDWEKRLDSYLQFTGRDVLNNAGTVLAADAKAYAEAEYKKFRVVQDKLYKSDFDKLVEKAKE